MITPEEKQNIIKILNDRLANLPCPRCGNKQFSLTDGYTSQFIQNKIEEVNFGGASIPSITAVCTRCGFLSQHSLGVLGLLPSDKNK